MRIATWNVNSLKARLDKVTWWLERARPDVLLMQETKLVDVPAGVFERLGYRLAHHGEGRWNGVAGGRPPGVREGGAQLCAAAAAAAGPRRPGPGAPQAAPPERAASPRLIDWGLVDSYRRLHQEGDRFTWWDYRAGMFHKNYGMRIDHLLVTAPLAARIVLAEI